MLSFVSTLVEPGVYSMSAIDGEHTAKIGEVHVIAGENIFTSDGENFFVDSTTLRALADAVDAVGQSN